MMEDGVGASLASTPGCLEVVRDGVRDFVGVFEGEGETLCSGDDVSDDVGDGETEDPIDSDAVGVPVLVAESEGESLTVADAEGDIDTDALNDIDGVCDEECDSDCVHVEVTEIVGVVDDDLEMDGVLDGVLVSLGVLVSDRLILLVFVEDRVMVIERDAVAVSEGLRVVVGDLELDLDSLGVFEDEDVVLCTDGCKSDRHIAHTKIVRRKRHRLVIGGA
jgi:hypothetical protein